MLLAFTTVPLVISGKQFLLGELVEASVERDCLLASAATEIIVHIAVQSKTFNFKLCFFIDHDLKSDLPVIFEHGIQVPKFNLSTSFLKIVSTFVIFRLNFTDVIVIVVSSSAEFAHSFSSAIATALVRRVILYLQVYVFIYPLFECLCVFFRWRLLAFERSFHVIVDLFLHFNGRVVHVEVEEARNSTRD